jgi:hypothetical protein
MVIGSPTRDQVSNRFLENESSRRNKVFQFTNLLVYEARQQAQSNPCFDSMDADNREIGTTGKKLSHPGLEVQSAMTIIWSMLILERVCGFS